MAGKRKPSEAGHEVLNLAGHPQAQRGIRRTRAWGGLTGFALAGTGAWIGGGSWFDVGLYGLIAGVLGQLVGWWLALGYWSTAVRLQHKPPEKDEEEAGESSPTERASI